MDETKGIKDIAEMQKARFECHESQIKLKKFLKIK